MQTSLRRNPSAWMLIWVLATSLLAPQVADAQLPAIADPLYTIPIADPAAIPKFVNPLPVLTAANGGRIDVTGGGQITMVMGSTTQDLGLLGPNPPAPLMTEVWGYGPEGSAVSYPGPTLVAAEGAVLNVQWKNELPYHHPLPLDETLHWSLSHLGLNISETGVPAVAHLHGGHTESASDGLPEQWFTPDGAHTGDHFVKTLYTYHNDQEAATLWYHDHALGITRLNVYMGLAGFYLLRDANEQALIAGNSLPSGDQEIEIVIQDRMFYPNGALAYPDAPVLGIAPSAQPEFFGDVILVNGKAWPVLDVQPRKYRFRLLNGSDSRFYDLRLDPGVSTTQPLRFQQIGTDDGLIETPVSRRSLLFGPGERYDVVVDFSDPALLGQTVVVRNSARSPFPKGATVNPNTSGQIMAFRVGATPVPDPVTLPPTLRDPIFPLVQTGATRSLLLFEGTDQYGRLKPLLGTVADGALDWSAPITENPQLNDVEVWEVYNSTMDAHPVHLHLVAFQILSRQKFTAAQDPATGALSQIKLKGQPASPAAEEAGWKDTAIMYPGEVTRVIAKFDREGRYVWHCHILSHEDHEMMRPYEVLPAPVLVAAKPVGGADPVELTVWPTPFNPVTTVQFVLPEEADVRLVLFNTLGQEIRELAHGVHAPGKYEIRWDGRDQAGHHLASGVYIARLEAGTQSVVRKLLLAR